VLQSVITTTTPAIIATTNIVARVSSFGNILQKNSAMIILIEQKLIKSFYHKTPNNSSLMPFFVCNQMQTTKHGIHAHHSDTFNQKSKYNSKNSSSGPKQKSISSLLSQKP
jgi:hypothetical protein